MEKLKLWEETIKKLLGNENPCEICLVKVTCTKSFAVNTACEKLGESLIKALEDVKNES
ncbi:MAG: hypothetical protein KAJ19_21150 [Gammaproteobacteria bacterium]|nr:hypothetical protein [Gammaproteobacteria bacterium]